MTISPIYRPFFFSKMGSKSIVDFEVHYESFLQNLGFGTWYRRLDQFKIEPSELGLPSTNIHVAAQLTASSLGSLVEYHIGVIGSPCLIKSLHVLSITSISSMLSLGVSNSIKHLLVSPIVRYLQAQNERVILCCCIKH